MPIPTEWNLTGKSALITADRRGWTPALASALAEAGADVAIAGSEASDMREAAAAVQEHGRRSFAIPADLTSAADIEATVDSAIGELGRIDILVNNARAEFAGPFLDVTDSEWSALMEFNVGSAFLCTRTVGGHMVARGGGRVVNISSGLSARGLAGSVAACAAQGAIRQLTAALALEWAGSNIRVNAIGAGWITVEPPSEEAERELLVRYIPSRRKGRPSDLCGLLVYLASDASDYVTGQTMFIDGGVMAHV